MFINKEKHEKVVAQLKAMQDRRAALYTSLGMDEYDPSQDITEFDPENNEDPVLTAVQSTVQAKDDAEASVQTEKDAKTQAENDLNDAKAAQKTAEDNLSEVTTELNDLGEDVQNAEGHTAKVEAVRTMLAAKPGSTTSNADTKKDEFENTSGVDQETIDNLPHNKEADQVLEQ